MSNCTHEVLMYYIIVLGSSEVSNHADLCRIEIGDEAIAA